MKFKNSLYSIQIAPSQIKELNEISVETLQNGLTTRCLKVGAAVTISQMEDAMKKIVKSEQGKLEKRFVESTVHTVMTANC